MEKITGFRLSDGRIIEDEKEAIILQKEIDLEQAVYDFAQREGVYQSKEDIYNAIMNNVDELRKILKNN